MTLIKKGNVIARENKEKEIDGKKSLSHYLRIFLRQEEENRNRKVIFINKLKIYK